jgi:hypothetical protein
MQKRILAALWLSAGASWAQADVVELSPDLYLVIRQSRVEDAAALKVGAITEANQLAASTGRVAAPLTGRFSQLGPILKQYEYQFRVMSREEALAAKPALADVVVGVNGVNTCGLRAAPAVAAILPELGKLEPLSSLGLLAAEEKKVEEETPAPELPAPVPEQAAPNPSVQ